MKTGLNKQVSLSMVKEREIKEENSDTFPFRAPLLMKESMQLENRETVVFLEVKALVKNVSDICRKYR